MSTINSDHLAHIQRLRGADAEIVPLDSGEMNDMILVDGREVFRFPRTDESKRRLHYESRVLTKLDNQLVTPIPRLIHFNEAVPYSVLSYIEGDIYDEQEIHNLSRNQTAALAVTLATFMRELNEHLDVPELEKWTAELMSEPETWDAYYERIAGTKNSNPYVEQYTLQYEKVKRLRSNVVHVPTIAIHGDLHGGNMLFRDGQLAGLIDFGDCETGTIYNELRPLYNTFGTHLVEQIIDKLGDSLGEIHLELVKEYALMHELSVMARSTPDQLAGDSRVDIAKHLLNKWMSDESEDKPQIKAVIFDCFGVLTSEKWIPFRRRHFHTADAKAFARRMMGDLVTGRMKHSEFVSTIARKGNLDEDEVRDSLTGSQPDEELFGWIKANKHLYKIGMLSNAGSNVLNTLFRDEQLALFDDIVLSYQVGLAKPDPAAYKLAAERLGVRPEECVFVDDKEEYCTAAREVGMYAVRYREFAQFRNEFDSVIR